MYPLPKLDSIKGNFQVPGDKSISIRSLLIGSCADGTSIIRNLNPCLDVHSTISCLEHLGISINSTADITIVQGLGSDGLAPRGNTLNAGNSATLMRLLAGILASRNIQVTLTGDQSLLQRPMERIIEPLSYMGASIDSNNGYPPLVFKKGNKDRLKGIEYELKVASAQVKSCLILAGLAGQGETILTGKINTRNHTELMLKDMNIDIDIQPERIMVPGGQIPQAAEIHVPGDVSSAMYLVAMSLLLPESKITIENVGINPTRIRALEILTEAGSQIKILHKGYHGLEPCGDIVAESSRISPFDIRSEQIPLVIDEIPILALLAAFTRGTSRFIGCHELRGKESDRLASIAYNLGMMGSAVKVIGDDLIVTGDPSALHGGNFKSYGDHRIALTFSIAGMILGDSSIDDINVANISYPDFVEFVNSHLP